MVVLPGAMPVTVPVVDIVPAAGLLLTHVPPAGALLSSVVLPWHTAVVPAIGAGSGFTLTVAMVCVLDGRV